MSKYHSPQLDSRNYFSSHEILQRSLSNKSGKVFLDIKPQQLFTGDSPWEAWKYLKDHNLRSGLPTLEQLLGGKLKSPLALQDFITFLKPYSEGRRLLQYWEAVTRHQQFFQRDEMATLPASRHSNGSQFMNHSAYFNSSRTMLLETPTSPTPPQKDFLARPLTFTRGPASAVYSGIEFYFGGGNVSPSGQQTSTCLERNKQFPLSPQDPMGSLATLPTSSCGLPKKGFPSHWVDPANVEQSALEIIRTFLELESASISHRPLALRNEHEQYETYPELVSRGLLFPTRLREEVFLNIEKHGLGDPHLFANTLVYSYTVLNHRYYKAFLTSITTQNISKPHGVIRLSLGALFLTTGMTVALYCILGGLKSRKTRLLCLPPIFLGWWNIIIGLTYCAPELALCGIYESKTFKFGRIQEKCIKRPHIRNSLVQLGWTLLMTLIHVLILMVVPTTRLARS
ncbi:hypothetical protein IWQ61_000316 [Dispira simplex]|nr:hypothetical protein IWQ61_000316 [Dispira simplex]